MTNTTSPVHYWESFTKDVLHTGESVTLHNGRTVVVGEVLDCGRLCERRFWWFEEDLTARLADTFARLADVCARNAAQHEDARLARIPEERRPANREGW